MAVSTIKWQQSCGVPDKPSWRCASIEDCYPSLDSSYSHSRSDLGLAVSVQSLSLPNEPR